jgi:PhnB protein
MKSPTSAGTSTVTLHIYSKNVDRLWEQAVLAGAKVLMPLDNQFWGERYGQLADPFGHRWSISMQVKMSKEEMEAKQQAAMAMFAQGERPGTTDQPST